jgi:hypothetical protein
MRLLTRTALNAPTPAQRFNCLVRKKGRSTAERAEFAEKR